MNTPTNQPRHALLLVGSAKKEHESTSEALGHYLLEQLAAQGFSSETIHVQRALRTPDRTSEFLALVDAADLFVLAFPVYVDSLPYLVTRAMEQIAEHRQSQPNPRRAGFLAIANCGFPEAQHCKTALDICAVFAQQAHFEWRGGLALGEGGMVAGRALAEQGSVLKQCPTGLEMTAAAGKVMNTLRNRQLTVGKAIDPISALHKRGDRWLASYFVAKWCASTIVRPTTSPKLQRGFPIMTETLFQLANLYIMPFWLLMIFLPHWSWTKRIIGSLWFIAPLAIAYALLIIPQMGGGGGGLVADLMNPTTEGLAKLLGNPAGVAVGWIHFLAFDLFVGRWEYLDSREKWHQRLAGFALHFSDADVWTARDFSISF